MMNQNLEKLSEHELLKKCEQILLRVKRKCLINDTYVPRLEFDELNAILDILEQIELHHEHEAIKNLINDFENKQ